MVPVRLALLLGAQILFGLLTPGAIIAYRGATTQKRILVAVGVLAPIGLTMGIAMPRRLRAAAIEARS